MSEPMTPSDCDLQDFKFMPLDVSRLRDSDLVSDETPEACWAALLLWCASWHQIPAASIPDNDQWQAKHAGYVARGRVDPMWPKIKEAALRGFVTCTDGRLYHPVVAEKARDAWASKLEQRWRTEIGRIKKHNDRHGTAVLRPSFAEWMSSGRPSGQPLDVPGDKPPVSPGSPKKSRSKGQGEGQGQGQGQGQGDHKDKAPAPSTFVEPDWLPPEPWAEFVAMRRAKGQRAPFTVAAAKGVIAALDKFRLAGHDLAAILRRSVVNGWSDVYEPKSSGTAGRPQTAYQAERAARIAEIAPGLAAGGAPVSIFTIDAEATDVTAKQLG